MSEAIKSETELQKHTVKLLETYARNDICWFAVPNGEYRKPKTAARLKLLGVRPGVADFIFLIDTKSFALELKWGKNKQTDSQLEWEEEWERAGGFYFIACTISEVISILRTINAVKQFAPLDTSFLPSIQRLSPRPRSSSARSPKGIGKRKRHGHRY